MKIIDRYITKKFISWIFFFLLAFTFIYIIIDLFEHLDDFLTLKVALKIILQYYLLFIPPIFVQIIPVAILLSTLFVLGYMTRFNETVALKACGVSLYHLILPFIKLALGFSLLTFLVNETIVPISFNKLNIAKEKNWSGQAPSKTLHDLTFYGSERRFYYIKTFDFPAETMEGILLLEYYPDRTIKIRVDAEKAVWQTDGWVFRNGIVRYFDQEGQQSKKEEVFEQRKMHFKEIPEDFWRQQTKLETMNIAALLTHIRYLKHCGVHPHKELVELQYRFASPLFSFFIILLGIPFALRSSRASVLHGAGIALVLCLFYYACISLALAMGKQRGFPPFLSAWSANILFGGLGLFLLKRTPK
ncbi:MAG: LptF/LptG family permease [Candidatus Ratteibacteria bacterium]|nr:LptF/LptG family permease [Candidatus Ratteibacteria bacterium]